jgi:translation initiation factor 4G
MKQREADMERMRQQSQRGGGGRPPLGRGDTRNFSGAYGQMPPPDYSGKVGSDDLRRLGSKGAARQVSQPGGPVSFGPGGLLGSRSNSGRKGLGPNMSRGGDDSGASSRTATPPAQKEKEKDDKNAPHTNTFR